VCPARIRRCGAETRMSGDTAKSFCEEWDDAAGDDQEKDRQRFRVYHDRVRYGLVLPFLERRRLRLRRATGRAKGVVHGGTWTEGAESGKRPTDLNRTHFRRQKSRRPSSAFSWADLSGSRRFASLVGAAEPSSYLSHDLVDLERLQKARFLCQCRTPFRQDGIGSLLRLLAFINYLLDGRFPIVKTHRLCLVDSVSGRRAASSVERCRSGAFYRTSLSSIVMARLARRNFDRLMLPEITDLACVG
jgi:hypothetical protein